MRRVGLIGCGGIVQRAHAVGYRASAPNVQVVALADVSERNRETAGTTFGIQEAQRYADYREMLAHAAIDTVVIATPHSFHAAQAIASAEAGKAIISEKPMAVTLEDADAILAAVAGARVPYTVIHNFLWTQQVQGAVALLAQGITGARIVGRAEMLAQKADETTRTDLDWRASRQFGGGALIDSSYHEIYTVETLMGSAVRSVDARLATLKFPIDVDDTAVMLYEHESGALSTVQAAWCVRAPSITGRWVHIQGTQGAVRVIHRDAEVARAVGRGGAWEPVPVHELGVRPPISGDESGHGAFLRAAFEALEAGAPMPISGAQARHNLAIIDAARQASARRRAVEVAP